MAANFRPTLAALAPQFRHNALKISSGSSGNLYAQIIHGAPFDVFLSADSRYPIKLEQQHLAVANSRFTYASGILVLVYQPGLAAAANNDMARLLQQMNLTTAIANPALAPYGAAARQVLSRFANTDRQLVTGANSGQAFQMWYTGGADIALVAASQAQPPFFSIPRDWYGDLKQQAVILRQTEKLALAQSFTAWLKSSAIQEQITAVGYEAVRD